jgi:hypothetical protein
MYRSPPREEIRDPLFKPDEGMAGIAFLPIDPRRG